MLPGLREWWARPCGGREVLAISMPLVISMSSWTVMNFTDRMFLVWYGTAAVAAALPAGMLHFTLVCFPLGVVSYAGTFVAQYEGAGRPERVGLLLGQATWIALLATPALLATIPLAPWLFALAGHQPELARLETLYYQVVTLGAGGTLVAAAQSAFFTGRGLTRVVMVVDSASALLNVLLDYMLIFGRLGAPEMGIAGAALATAASQWAKVACYGWIMRAPRHRQRYQLAAGRRLHFPLLLRLWRYGGPSGLQLLVEVAAFTVFLLVVGWLGKRAMAATTLAFNVNSVAFVPMLGLGIGVTTLVGQQLGGHRPDLAARATWTAFWMAMVYTGVLGVLYVAAPDAFLVGYAFGADAKEFLALRGVVVVLLRFVTAYCLFDAMNVIFSAAIKGAGDTRFILLVGMVVSPLPVLLAWWGVAWCGWGLIWCWIVLTAWTCGLGAIYLARFLQGRWRSMRVIEPELLPASVNTGSPRPAESADCRGGGSRWR